MAQQYTVKAGDTLNKIASSLGYKNYTEAGITGYDNPDQIKVGQVLTIGGGPKTSAVPGIGTLTVTPKNIPTAPATNNAPEDLSGAYARAGITPPTSSTPATPSGYQAPSVAGIPSYPSGVNSGSSVDTILSSYKTTLDTITELEKKIASSATASPEEQALQKELAAKKSQLASFDLGSLQASEALKGQGRGMTLANIGLQDAKIARTRALERLGLAQEADTLTSQLALTQDQRKQQGDLATTEYNLATKKLDLALGIQDKIDKIHSDEKDNARQFLLDAVNFADGKTYDQLDADTQAAITSAVASSPITLDMVKTALSSGAEKAAAAKLGNLRSVAGLGVVQINPDGSYRVVVPENPTPSPSANVPTFDEYAAAQNIPFPALTQAKIQQLHAEYDAKYGNAAVSLGKLTATNRNDLNQAGLISAPTAVQSYFLNAPAEFRDSYQRDVASGKVSGGQTLAGLTAAYTAWYNANKAKSGSHDWSALLGQ